MTNLLSIPVETRRTLAENDKRWTLDLYTRLLAAFFSVIGIIIFAATVHQSKSKYGGNDWTDGMPIGPLLLALLFNVFKTTFNVYHRRGCAIHPGWSVAADLLTWALGVPAIIFSVGDGWFWWWQPVVFKFKDGFIPCEIYNFWSQPCNPLIYKLGKQEMAANVFLALVILMHFPLFVRACILTHRLRKSKKREAAARGNIELQYNRSPVQHDMEAPPAYAPAVSAGESRKLPLGRAPGSVSPIGPRNAEEVQVEKLS